MVSYIHLDVDISCKKFIKILQRKGKSFTAMGLSRSEQQKENYKRIAIKWLENKLLSRFQRLSYSIIHAIECWESWGHPRRTNGVTTS